MVERGDFSDEFNAIIGEFRDEQNDPIVTEIFNSVTEAEVALNRAGEAGTSYIVDILAQLNYELAEADLISSEVVVSGVIRPSEYIAGGDEARTAEIIREQFGEIGPLKVDDMGPYFAVEQQQLVCGTFDVTEFSPGENESTIRKVIINLNSNEDEDPTEGWFYAFADELTVLAPVEASYLKVNREITQKYPDIAAQLEQIPQDCGNDQEIIDALQKVTLTIDWSKYPYLSEDDRDELFSMIETYMTHRVVLDNAMYSLDVNGTIIGFDVNGNEVVRELDSTKRINAYLGHIRLHHDSDEGDIGVYSPALEAYAPTANRLGGNNMLYLPVSSVESMQNSRNENLFDQEMGQYDRPTDTLDTESLAAETEDDTSIQQREADTSSEDASTERTPSDREQILEVLNAGITELFEKSAQYTQKLYSTPEEANADGPKLGEIIDEFFSKYPHQKMTYIRAEGPGVLSCDAVYNAKASEVLEEGNESIRLQFDNAGLHEGDIFTTKEGLLTRDANVIVQGVRRLDDENPDEEEPSGYVLRAYMILRDREQPRRINFGAGAIGVPMYSLAPSKQFVVELDAAKTRLSVPEYERIKSIEDAIYKIAQELPDLKTLPWYLYDLNKEVDEAAPQEYNDLTDPTLLNKIGEDVGGDELASRLTVDALSEILHGYSVEVTGPMYTADGMRTDNLTVRGVVETVISTLPDMPTEEPMIVIELEDITWYVPIAELERFRY